MVNLSEQLKNEIERLQIQEDCDLVRIKELIKAGADVNYQIDDDVRLIDIPILENRLDVVKLLIEYGAFVNLSEDEREWEEQEQQDLLTPLQIAAQEGFQEIFDYLAPLTDSWRRWLATMDLPGGLEWRARREGLQQDCIDNLTEYHSAVVRALLQEGSDFNSINSVGSNGCSLLWTAAHNGYLGSVQLLLESGASPNIKNHFDGWSPLMVLVATHSAWLLGAYQAGWENTIIERMRANRVNIARMLIEAGADIDASTNDGSTPLMAASGFEPALEMIELLLESGADVNARRSDGKTVLCAFCQLQQQRSEESRSTEEMEEYREKQISTLNLLISAGADVNATDYTGRTPLIEVAGVGDLEMASILLQSGAEPNMRDSSGKTALSYAQAKSHVEVVQVLQEMSSAVE